MTMDDSKVCRAKSKINYVGGKRGGERIVYSNDGLIFVTYDDYRTFIEIKVLGKFVQNQSKNQTPKNVYDSLKDSPNYPKGFKNRQNGTTKRPADEDNQYFLRQSESGKWYKVYKDGYDSNGNKVSVHYFESPSGRVFDVQVKWGKWSNP